MGEQMSEHDVVELSEDLRRAIGAFVRAVYNDPAARKSAQTETLGLLDREGPMNVASLAEARNVTHQTMRLIVGQLEKAALIQRAHDPADRRSQLISISNVGRAELVRGQALRASKIEGLIRTTLSTEELRILRSSVGLLDRMTAATDVNCP